MILQEWMVTKQTRNFTPNRRKSFCFGFALVFGVSFALMPAQAQAAELYFGSVGQQVKSGTSVEIGLFLNTEGAEVNAAEGAVIFSAERLTLKEIYVGDSVVNAWLERPQLRDPACSTECAIIFSGIAVGGYVGDRALLFSAVFETRGKGAAEVFVRDERVLLDDGQGTAVSVRVFPLDLQIVPADGWRWADPVIWGILLAIALGAYLLRGLLRMRFRSER